MKKGFYFLLLAALFHTISAKAQNVEEIYQEIMLTDELKTEDKMQEVRTQARNLLEQKPEEIKINIPKAKIEIPRRLKKVEVKKAEPENLSSAPFGLLWGATILDIQSLGIELTPIDEKDYVNNFRATQLPKSINGFRQVNVTFGVENELWRIIAYGDFIDDDSLASKVLLQYRKYYKLLSQKYGNPQQFYTPKTEINLDKNVKTAPAPAFNPAKDFPSEQNAKDLLKNLQSGEAVLYATFDNKDVGAALAVNVDGNGKSYIIIDYKSLRILRQREAQTLDAL